MTRMTKVTKMKKIKGKRVPKRGIKSDN